MCLRGKRAYFIAGCLGIAMLCALVVVKTREAGGSLPIWGNTGRSTAGRESSQEGNDGSGGGQAQNEGIVGVQGEDAGGNAGGNAGGMGSQDGDGVAYQEDMSIKKVALTFDDGPHPRYTEQLLEGLRKRNVCVTFFVLGQSAERYPELIREMAQDGHLIGNHTYSHMQLTRRNGQRFAEELQKTDAVIFEITGQHTEFVRPPYGAWDKRYEESLNMIQVLWNVDPLDWCCSDAGTVVSRVVEKTNENSIILLHDVYASSVEAALAIIDELSARGYEFVTVDEIILD